MMTGRDFILNGRDFHGGRWCDDSSHFIKAGKVSFSKFFYLCRELISKTLVLEFC